MTLKFVQGNMFNEHVDAIVNTVNCVGVMGKGVALEFKKRWPDNYKAYKSLCEKKQVVPGKVFIFERSDLLEAKYPRYLVNFPTKNHWRSKSKIEYISDGLDDLVLQLKNFDIKTLVMPPLGCGNGGLDWVEVKALISAKLQDLDDVEIRVYEPREFTPKPEFSKSISISTPERATYIKALGELEDSFGGRFTNLVLHKLAYFLQESGLVMNLNFAKDQRGPYSAELKGAVQALVQLGYLDVDSSESSVYSVSTSAFAAADELIATGDVRYNDIVERVSLLVAGFESPDGMELLSSVHFVHPSSVDDAIQKLYDWNESKKRFPKEHIEVAYKRLKDDHYLN